jgi:enoyl-CoA hydratase
MDHAAPPTIRAVRRGRAGRITLDRPRALNALDSDMIAMLHAALLAWRDDPSVHLVVLDSASDRAFCAGGDIRAIRDFALAGDAAGIEAFFAAEYALNAAIAAFPKPWVSMIDGLCLGGGIGISVHGSHRVATPRAAFAMPETAIALFPDVGTTHVLPRLPGAVGMWLALTGTRVTGADAVHAGFATHFVAQDTVPALIEELCGNGIAALAPVALPLPACGFAPHRAAIDACFGQPDVPSILAALDAGDDWARAQAATLRAMSPSSLLWTHGIVSSGARRTLDQCLAAELALTRHVTRHPDFAEGVRAMVVDKDRTPRWSPARLEDVDPAAIAAMLA